MSSYDPVEKPYHYNVHPSGIECIEVTRHMNFNCGNAVKYVWRAGLKPADPNDGPGIEDAVQDLRKAIWYLEDEIDRLILSRNPATIEREHDDDDLNKYTYTETDGIVVEEYCGEHCEEERLSLPKCSDCRDRVMGVDEDSELNKALERELFRDLLDLSADLASKGDAAPYVRMTDAEYDALRKRTEEQAE